MLKQHTVFQAHCHGRSCRVSTDDGSVDGWASLVSISPLRARLHLAQGLRGPFTSGQQVHLDPGIMNGEAQRIQARIDGQEGDCLYLCFEPALPLGAHDLMRLLRCRRPNPSV